ncbi:hypothetical protein BSKO_05799 [Bryopsis sp. KO-2023]|nr:hypothetical protein BSKO_05799 [Bryopsis sp. KO-2023]
MGALFSIFHWNKRLKGVPLETEEAKFDTGDVVLFGGRGMAAYLSKIGTWSGFTNVGFIIRDRPGLEGLNVCYSGAPVGSRAGGEPSDSQYGRVKISSLVRFLEVGQFDVVVVRKLSVPLDADEKSQVESFAKSSKGKVLNNRVTLLMPAVGYDSIVYKCCSLACCSFTEDVERFFCSELVVDMLERVSRVVKNNNEYVPASEDPNNFNNSKLGTDGKVLGPAINVKLPVRSSFVRHDWREAEERRKSGSRGEFKSDRELTPRSSPES